MVYTFDEILRRMVYMVPLDVEVDMKAAVEVANMFRSMNKDTREYVLSRLDMIKDEYEV